MTFTQKVPCSPFRERELYKLILDVSPKIDFLLYHEMTISILSWVLYLSLDSSLLRCTWAVCYSKKDFGLGGTHPGSTLKSRNPGVPVLGWCLPFPTKYWFLKKSHGFFPDTSPRAEMLPWWEVQEAVGVIFPQSAWPLVRLGVLTEFWSTLAEKEGQKERSSWTRDLVPTYLVTEN